MKIKEMIFLVFILCFLNIYSFEIRVVTENYPPFNYIENNRITGVSTEVVRRVLEIAGIDNKIKEYPWARAYLMAKNNPNVLIYSIKRTKEREEYFKFIGPVTQSEFSIYTLKESKLEKIEKIEDLKEIGMIGVVNQDICETYLHSRGIMNTESVSTLKQNIRKLLTRKVDAIAYTGIVINFEAEKSILDISTLKKIYTLNEISGELDMAFNIETSDELIEIVEAALRKLIESGEYDEIQNRWLN